MSGELQKLLAGVSEKDIHPGLEALRAVLARMGDPQNDIASIHVAGTDGKGATCALCESVLRHAGYPVGRYVSPHLVDISERFWLNGRPASAAALDAAAGEVLAAQPEELSYFERLTATAFALFRAAGVKLVVLETGLGGRLDATNVVTPLVSVITRIGLDHTAWLGETIEQIAGEKAGIVKPGRPVVCGAMPPEAKAVVAAAARAKGTEFIDVEEEVSVRASHRTLKGQKLSIATRNRSLPPVQLPLAGAFQAENVATAMAALECVNDLGLPVPDEAFVAGLEEVVWPGRFQLLREDPPLLVDGAHNPCAAEALLAALKSCGERRPLVMVAGFCADKDVLGFLRLMKARVAGAYAVRIPSPRSLDAAETAALMKTAGFSAPRACASLREAVELARAQAKEQGGVVLVCGSLFLAGELLAQQQVEDC